ncbi:ArnT family glycosyltransferase [Ancylobacter defluvii]|uniref:Glycosyl transferase n=1 Tax=Ancylobacter defluvii TaxID=1282440 RepID=A0A9W6NDK5_9HYPH|nr:glycosyltransferase family 39 protein [Ancylobacter defluvii]MBS7588338.1 glycosyltransferase family 39 protein [Ancylobacter defluvii]GLK86742.1 glycosyl transferase [Ancylobacter defluvii]
MSDAAGSLRSGRLGATSLAGLGERHARLLLVLLFFACVLPGFFTLPVIDRDEARFAQASRQMVESGDYVAPRLGDEYRFKKPIGIYWLQTAAVKLTGLAPEAPIWAYRLPSLFAALIAVLVTHAVGLRLFSPRAAFFGAALLAASLILGAEARLAKTDATLLAFAVTGQLVLARLHSARADEKVPLGWTLLFWGAMGGGILIKGPIVPMLAGFTVLGLLAWERRGAWLKPLRPMIGVPFLLLIVLPWLIAIWLNTGMAFFHEAVGNDLLGKVATGQESHGAPPGAHLLAFFVIFWPGAALAAIAAPWVWSSRSVPAVRFALCWIVPFWIAFELFATKLPHYTLPTYPAIALLAGAALASGRLTPPAGWARLLALAAAVGGILAGIGLVVVLHRLSGLLPAEALGLVALATVIGGFAAYRALSATLEATYPLLIAQAVVLYGLGFGVAAPRLEALWVSPQVARSIAAHAPCPDPQVLVSGFTEASTLFVLGTDTRHGTGAEAADFLAGPGCRVVAVTDRQRAAFEARERELGQQAALIDTVSGFNLGNGRWMTLQILATPANATKGS